MKSINPFKIYSNLSQLKKNVVSGSIYAGLNIIVLLVSYPIFLKYLGTELYGLWATISVVVVFSRLGELGIDRAVIKYVAEEYGKQSFNNITGYITTAFYVLSTTSVFIVLISILFNREISKFLNFPEKFVDEAVILIPLMGIMSGVVFITNIVKGTLSGLGRIDLSNYIFLGGRITGFIISIILILAGLSIWGLYIGVLSSNIISSLIFGIIIKYKFNLNIFRFKDFSKQKFKNLLYFGGTMTASKVMKMLLDPLNKVLISKYIGLSEVTFYEIAFKGVRQLGSIYVKGIQAIMPKISEIQHSVTDSINRIKIINKKSILFVVIAGLPVFLGMFIFAGIFLKLWLGNNYNVLILISFRYFLIAFYFNLLGLPAFNIFMGINRVSVCFKGIFIRSSLYFISVVFLLFLKNFKITYMEIVVLFSFSFAVATFYYLYMYYKLIKNRMT